MNNISQRDAFWDRVYELAKRDKDIVIITADMGAPSLDKIRKELASQFINVGIAEQNAITIASGLALTGKKVFAYAIAPFITLRCLEQIRVENAIMNIPITIVGVGAGFSYKEAGPTHHLLEDVGVLRTFPNIKVHTMSDSVMASVFAEMTCNSKNTDYVRIYRQTLPTIYKNSADFSKGFNVFKKHKDTYIISSGSMVQMALDMSKKFDIGVIDLFTLPISEELLHEIKACKKIVTIEENFLPCGMGSAVLEFLNDNKIDINLKRIGISLEKGYCYKYGGIDIIRKYYGIDVNSVDRQIKNFIK